MYDSYFANVNNFYKVKVNYGKEDCVRELKKKLSYLGGIDRKFLSTILNNSISDFDYYYYYVPVYYMNVLVKYTWNYVDYKKYEGNEITLNVKEEGTNSKLERHKGLFYYGMTLDANYDTFIGSDSYKFTKINLPSNLEHNIYSSSCIKRVDYVADECAINPDRNEKEILSYTCDVYFVPIVRIIYYYNGYKYEAIGNLHNGDVGYEYVMDKNISNILHKKHKIIKVINIIMRIILISTIPLSFVNCYYSDRTILSLLLIIVCIPVVVGLMTLSIYFTEYKSLEDEYSLSKKFGNKLANKRIFWSVLILIAILFIIYKLVRFFYRI